MIFSLCSSAGTVMWEKYHHQPPQTFRHDPLGKCGCAWCWDSVELQCFRSLLCSNKLHLIGAWWHRHVQFSSSNNDISGGPNHIPRWPDAPIERIKWRIWCSRWSKNDQGSYMGMMPHKGIVGQRYCRAKGIRHLKVFRMTVAYESRRTNGEQFASAGW